MCSPMSAKAMISSRLAAISARREAEQRRREIDVGEARILRMEARAELEQRADAPAALDDAARRRDHAGDDLQQGRLAGAVLADDAERLAGGEVERDLVQRLEHLRSTATAQEIEHQPQPAGIGVELRIVLADAGEVEQCGHQRLVRRARLDEIFEMRRQAQEHPSAGRKQRQRDDDRERIAPDPGPVVRRAARRAADRPGSRTGWRRPTASRCRGPAIADTGSASGTSGSSAPASGCARRP